MSEEEKVIQFYKKFIDAEEKELEWMYKNDEEFYKDDIEQKELLIKGWKKILEIITRLQKEKEHQTEKINNQKAELAILNEKQKDMNKLINDVKSYEGQFKRQEKEIREKNKQIDLMAGYINYLSDELVKETGKNELEFCDMERCEENHDIDCEECIKQYFEKLAKGE